MHMGAGYDDQGAQELMRLYQTIHTDHEASLLFAGFTHVCGVPITQETMSYAGSLKCSGLITAALPKD